MPEVSVIVACYNSEKYLRETLQSLVQQTYRDFEVIVVDDGSTDLTRQIVGEFQQQLQMEYVCQSNKGPGGAHKRGFQTATGKYIALLDHDDNYLPQKLERQISVFREHPEVGMAYSDAFVIDVDGNRIGQYFSMRKVVPCRGRVFGDFVQRNRCQTSTTMFSRVAIKKNIEALRPYRYANDYNLYLKVLYEFPAGFLNEPLSEHRFHPSMTSNVVGRAIYDEPIEIMDGWLARIAMNDLGLRNTIMKRRGELKLRLSKWLFEREEIGEARAIYRDAVFDDEYLGRNVRGRLMFHFPGLWRSFRAAKHFAGV